MKKNSDPSFRSLICGEPLRSQGPWLSGEDIGRCNLAATLPESGLQGVPRGGAQEVVAEKAQPLTVPWAAQGRSKGTGKAEPILGHCAPEEREPETCRPAWWRLRKPVPPP